MCRECRRKASWLGDRFSLCAVLSSSSESLLQMATSIFDNRILLFENLPIPVEWSTSSSQARDKYETQAFCLPLNS